MITKIINNIKTFFSRFDDVVSRKTLMESLDESLNALNSDLDNQASNIAEMVKISGMDLSDDKFTKDIVSLSKVKAKNVYDFVSILRNVSKEIVNHDKELRELISDLPAGLVPDSLSVKQLATIKLIDNIAGFVDCYGDYLFHLYNVITEVDDVTLVKKVDKRLEDRKIFFYIVIKELSIINELIDNIKNKLPDEPVNLKSESGISFIMNSRDGVVSGFAGNPIYFIGKINSDLKLAEAARMEERLKIYRLTLGKLKAEKEAGEDVPNYDRQIKYYTEKITEYERKIEKLRS